LAVEEWLADALTERLETNPTDWLYVPLAISCINVEDAPHGSLFVASRTYNHEKSVYVSIMRQDKTAHLRLHLRVVHNGCLYCKLAAAPGKNASCRFKGQLPTILHFPHPRFDVIQRQVTDLLLEATEIHRGCAREILC
jgi:hypothetical protein